MRRMGRYIECKDSVFKAVVLKILRLVALITIQNKEPLRPHHLILCMRVKVL